MNRNIWFLAMLLVVSLPIFSHLTSLPIQFWDESRLAVSAFEMTKSGNWLIPTFGNVPEMWSTKPPLMIWLIAGCMKILGPTEMAVRLPSALAAVFTCILWFWLIIKKWGTPTLGFIACIILISSPGYMRLHGVRTGDYDSLLVLFVSGYIIFYYLFVTENKRRYLYFFFLFLTAATMTKGIAGLLLLPGIFIYTIIEKKLLFVLRSSTFYLGIATFLLIVSGYYFFREYYNPGYISAVWQNELWGRYSTVIEEHNGSWMYYIIWLRNNGFLYYFPLLPFGLITGQLYDKQDFKSFSLYLSILIVSFIFILSGSKTQLEWYDMPAYPMMSALAALVIFTVLEQLNSSNSTKLFVRISLISVIVLVLFLPYKNIVENSIDSEFPSWSEENHWMALYLKKSRENNDKLKYSIFTSDSRQDQNLIYYFKVLEQKNKVVYKNVADLSVGDTVVVFKKNFKDAVKKAYDVVALDSFAGFVKVYKVNGIRKQYSVIDSSAGFQ